MTSDLSSAAQLEDLSRRRRGSGKAHCRSLGCARDDKVEGHAYLSCRYDGWKEPQVIPDFVPFGRPCRLIIIVEIVSRMDLRFVLP